jgi:hypothetical protein
MQAGNYAGLCEVEHDPKDAESPTLPQGTEHTARFNISAALGVTGSLATWLEEVHKIEAELARREAGRTPSDDTWNEWMRGETG